MLIYILVYSEDVCTEFDVLECARIYQTAFGGKLYSVELPDKPKRPYKKTI